MLIDRICATSTGQAWCNSWRVIAPAVGAGSALPELLAGFNPVPWRSEQARAPVAPGEEAEQAGHDQPEADTLPEGDRVGGEEVVAWRAHEMDPSFVQRTAGRAEGDQDGREPHDEPGGNDDAVEQRAAAGAWPVDAVDAEPDREQEADAGGERCDGQRSAEQGGRGHEGHAFERHDLGPDGFEPAEQPPGHGQRDEENQQAQPGAAAGDVALEVRPGAWCERGWKLGKERTSCFCAAGRVRVGRPQFTTFAAPAPGRGVVLCERARVSAEIALQYHPPGGESSW